MKLRSSEEFEELIRRMLACFSDSMLVDGYLDTLQALGPESREARYFAVEVQRRQLTEACEARATSRQTQAGSRG